jgi:prepilin peptidase CpaA
MFASLLPTFLVAAAVVAAAILDARTGLIPNALTLPVIGLALALHTVLGGPAAGLVSLVGCLLCALGPFIVYRASHGRAIGGGDIKLFGAIGACLGPMQGLEVELLSYLLVAVFALVGLSWRGRLLVCLGNTVVLVANVFLPASRRRAIEPELLSAQRMGPAICIATLALVLYDASVRLAL